MDQPPKHDVKVGNGVASKDAIVSVGDVHQDSKNVFNANVSAPENAGSHVIDISQSTDFQDNPQHLLIFFRHVKLVSALLKDLVPEKMH